MEQFRKLKLMDPLLRSIKDEGFTEPSEIQEKTIPLVLEGKDIIAGAATGSGKTLAFGSVILQNTKRDFGIQSLVLTPTRELAEQISKALNKFSKYNPLKIMAVYGGVSINPQIDNLEYADVVIGTPGRILDHISRNTIDLTRVKTLVLDEADRMLDMGFKDDVIEIINHCPKERQTLLFSATISEDISLIAKKYMNDPVEISAVSYVDPSLLTQVYYDVDDNLKFSMLVHLLSNEDAKLVMVFCNTRKNVDFVANNLRFNGIDSLPIHGGFSQEKRNKILNEFHNEKVQVLVCTDVAARGLDIKGVSHVYNYDMPNDSKEYVHRIGRTARAGKEGKVINIISSRDHENFRQVLENDSLKITSLETPMINRVKIRWIDERNNGRFRRNENSFGRNEGRFSRGRSRNNDNQRRDGARRSSNGRTNNFRSSSNHRDNRTSNYSNNRRRSNNSFGRR